MSDTPAPRITQRQIKFRAWIPSDQRMVSWEEMLGCNMVILQGSLHKLDGGDVVVFPMEFTGLKDKNGREIYEGDIIKTGTGYLNGHNGFHVVRLEAGDWSYSYWKNEVMEEPAETWEVVGNIHQDPALALES